MCDEPFPFDRDTSGMIRRNIRRLIDAGTIPRSDDEDELQRVFLHICEKLGVIDVTRPDAVGYLRRLVKNILLNDVRKGRAEKRSPKFQRSLADLIRDFDDRMIPFAETVSQREYDALRGRQFTPDEAAAFRRDLVEAKAHLPGRLGDLLDQVVQGLTFDEAADVLGIDRSTAYRWRDALAECLRQLGWGES